MQKLEKIPDKNPFKVPESYFEEVNRKIISATSGQIREVNKRGLHNRVNHYLLIAASLTVFTLLCFSASRLLAPDRANLQASETVIKGYPESFINEIDILTLEENAVLLVQSEEGPDLNKTDIIEYLLLENIEISDIYEQL